MLSSESPTETRAPATDFYRYGQDENAWCMKVTQRVLSFELSEFGVDFSELNYVLYKANPSIARIPLCQKLQI